MEQARSTLILYMKRVWEATGLEWSHDNEAEISMIIDHIEEDVDERIKTAIKNHSRGCTKASNFMGINY